MENKAIQNLEAIAIDSIGYTKPGEMPNLNEVEISRLAKARLEDPKYSPVTEEQQFKNHHSLATTLVTTSPSYEVQVGNIRIAFFISNKTHLITSTRGKDKPFLPLTDARMRYLTPQEQIEIERKLYSRQISQAQYDRISRISGRLTNDWKPYNEGPLSLIGKIGRERRQRRALTYILKTVYTNNSTDSIEG